MARIYHVWENQRGTVIRTGDRIKVRSRRGTTGMGTVTGIRENFGIPDTIMVAMDLDTVWQNEGGHPDEVLDQVRLPQFGLFGGEIEEVFPKHKHLN